MQIAEFVRDHPLTVVNAKMDSLQFLIDVFALQGIILPLTNSNAYHVELDVLLVPLELNVISVNPDINLLIQDVSLIAQLAPLMLEINAKNALISAATVPVQLTVMDVLQTTIFLQDHVDHLAQTELSQEEHFALLVKNHAKHVMSMLKVV